MRACVCVCRGQTASRPKRGGGGGGGRRRDGGGGGEREGNPNSKRGCGEGWDLLGLGWVFFAGGGSGPQGKNNNLLDLTSGLEERGVAKAGGAEAKPHRAAGGRSEPRRPGEGREGLIPPAAALGRGLLAPRSSPRPGRIRGTRPIAPRGVRGAGEGEGAACAAGSGGAAEWGGDTGRRHLRPGERPSPGWGGGARPGRGQSAEGGPGPGRGAGGGGGQQPAAGLRGARSSSSSSSSSHRPASLSGRIDRFLSCNSLGWITGTQQGRYLLLDQILRTLPCRLLAGVTSVKTQDFGTEFCLICLRLTFFSTDISELQEISCSQALILVGISTTPTSAGNVTLQAASSVGDSWSALKITSQSR
ncbi:glycine-rich protein DOT1-like [Tyto alba]|uniref:glycine-rich protein DOT1-like n=1 Tax=Tyto alba TaxID=56313 RepID=UPI001C673305|nr:glycine-rich protein DOT1-like [Tyto alba]